MIDQIDLELEPIEKTSYSMGIREDEIRLGCSYVGDGEDVEKAREDLFGQLFADFSRLISRITDSNWVTANVGGVRLPSWIPDKKPIGYQLVLSVIRDHESYVYSKRLFAVKHGEFISDLRDGSKMVVESVPLVIDSDPIYPYKNDLVPYLLPIGSMEYLQEENKWIAADVEAIASKD